MSGNSPIQLISPAEIRAVYRRGEEAVIELVEGLVEQVGKLEYPVLELEGTVKKNSGNSSKPPSGDGFGQKPKSLRSQSERKTGGQPEQPGSPLEWSDKVDAVVEHQGHLCWASLSSYTN